MTVYSGSLVLLKVKKDTESIIIGGMRTTKFSLNNQMIDATNKGSGNWRELLPSSGITYVTIAGNGVFTGEEAQKIITNAAFNNLALEYEISFASKEILKGKFHITNYERAGNFNEEENYHLVLESSGCVKYE